MSKDSPKRLQSLKHERERERKKKVSTPSALLFWSLRSFPHTATMERVTDPHFFFQSGPGARGLFVIIIIIIICFCRWAVPICFQRPLKVTHTRPVKYCLRPSFPLMVEGHNQEVVCAVYGLDT